MENQKRWSRLRTVQFSYHIRVLMGFRGDKSKYMGGGDEKETSYGGAM